MALRSARSFYGNRLTDAKDNPMEIAIINSRMEHTYVITMKDNEGVYHCIGTPIDVLNRKIESECGNNNLVSVEKISLIDAPKGMDIKLENFNIDNLTIDELLLMTTNETRHIIEETLEIKQAYKQNAIKKTL